ncbi:hypothetical protein AX761_21975 [Rhizobium sp. 58]|nr:hypothetical protein AX761_21975 [Rhizobium sp. 58]
MRHFRNAKEIEAFMIDEYLRQGIPVVCGGGMSAVPITRIPESGADELIEFDITAAAKLLWEALS